MINLLELKRTTQFKKDLKRIIKRGLPTDELNTVIINLRNQKPLEPKHFDHALTGNFKGFRECHIMPDWLLMYKVEISTYEEPKGVKVYRYWYTFAMKNNEIVLSCPYYKHMYI